MGKKCLRCGCDMKDSSASDYCSSCMNNEYPDWVTTKGNPNTVPKGLNLYRTEESTLIVIANIVIILGVLASIILAFTVIHDKYMGFNPTGLVITLSTLLSSIVTWAVLLCIAKTSKNIREIRNKLLS